MTTSSTSPLPIKIYGKEGNDTITGTGIIYGGADNDRINATGTIYGEDGNDNIETSGNNNTIYGGAGIDTITAHGYNDIIYGGTDNDNIVVGHNSELHFSKGDGDDIVTQPSDNYYLNVKLFFDDETNFKDIGVLYENDTLTLKHNNNNDSVSLMNYSNRLRATIMMNGLGYKFDPSVLSDQKMYVWFGDRENYIYDENALYYTVNNDVVNVTDITNKIYTGSGNDTITIDTLGYADYINLGSGNDTITIKGFVSEVDGDENRYGYITGAEIYDGNDTFTIENTAECDYLYGGGGDDNFTVYGNYHIIDGGSGYDTVNIYGQCINYPSDPSIISADNITIHEGATAHTIDGSTITLNGVADYIRGSGNDTINVSGTVRYIQTQGGNDEVTISGTVTQGLTTYSGNNIIRTTSTANCAAIEFSANTVGNDTLYLNATRDNLSFAMDDLTYEWSTDGKDVIIKYFSGRHTVTVKDFDESNTSIYVGDVLLSTLVPEKPTEPLLMTLSSPMSFNLNSLNNDIVAFSTNDTDMNLNYNDLTNTNDVSAIIAQYNPTQQ